jgi:hypothetical protein
MDTKYYTPIIEEFCVGLEYEKYNTKTATYRENDFKPSNWHKFTYSSPDISFYKLECYIQAKEIRVKYLDREDIESFGWKYISETEYDTMFMAYERNGYILTHSHRGIHIYKVKKLDSYTYDYNFFIGKIKNKLEFKKLMNQLEING